MATQPNRKVVVITGASSGIGRAAAHGFARLGCDLVLAARNLPALDQTVRECRELGARCISHQTDVGEWEEVDRLADAALTHFSRIDVWVNDAAVGLYGRVDEVPIQEFEKVVRTNLMGTVHGCRSAIRQFRRQGSGVLINISSMVGAVGQPLASAYVTTQWAIRGLGEALRGELLDQPGIHVCTVLPPSADTPFFQHAANHVGRQIRPMPPVLPPERVAGVIVGLAGTPRREVFVGLPAKSQNLLHKFAPALAERLMGRMTPRKHFADQPSPVGSGNLFEAQADAVHGGWAEIPPSRTGASRTAWVIGAAAIALPLGWVVWRQVQARSNGHSRYI